MIMISVDSQTGASMNNLTIKQLGKIVAGQITQKDSGAEGVKQKVFRDSDLEVTNIPVPIVLWDKKRNTVAKVLYYQKEIRSSKGSFKGSIDVLDAPGQGIGGRIKSMFDGYPITVSAQGIYRKEDERTVDFFVDFYTLDVNGDGVEELIVTRHTGGIDVYDRDKRIMKHWNNLKPDLFEYNLERTCTAIVDDHDELWLLRTRKPHDSVDTLSESDRRYYEGSRNYTIIRVSPDGIKEITPLFKGGMEPESICDVAVLNRPGSKEIDELILVSTFKDKKGYYMSRHTPSGSPLDEPREIHAESYDPAMATMFYIPQSNQIMAYSLEKLKILYFTPEKPVNWIKTVYLEDITGGEKSALYQGHTMIENVPVTLVEHQYSIYAIDANGKYRTSMLPGSDKKKDPVALGKIKPFSDEHNIIEMFPIGPDMDTVMVIESRSPKKREYSLEELEKAGEEFLPYDEMESCKSYLVLTYDTDTNGHVEWYCRFQKIPMPEIHSLEDIKNKLPGYYDEMVADAKSSYYTSLKVTLFMPISSNNFQMIEEDDYRSKEKYRRWLNDAFITPEIVVSIHRLSDGLITRELRTSFYFEDLESEAGTINLPSINVKSSGEHGQAIMVLHRKYLNLIYEPAFYTIIW